MTTGAGKTFTAITAVYRLLRFEKMNQIFFLVDTEARGIGGTGIPGKYSLTMTRDRFLISMVYPT